MGLQLQRENPKLGGSQALVVWAALVLFASIQPARANQACVSGQTLEQYQALASGCTIGNVLFNFSGDFYFPGGQASGVSASDVDLTIVGDGETAGAPVGFTFSTSPAGAWTATDGESSDVNLTFEAALVGQPANIDFNSATLSMNVTLDSMVFAYALGSESLAAYSGPDQGDPLGQIATLTLSSGTDYNIGSGTDLSPLVQNVTVTKNLSVGTSSDADLATINNFTETFTYTNTPEPGLPLLVGFGLLLFAGARWWKRPMPLSIPKSRIPWKHLAQPLTCLALLVVGASGAHAGTCTTQTVATYIASGGCVINDVLFTVVSYTPSGDVALAPLPTNVTVSPIQTLLDTGLDFGAVITTDSSSPVSITLVITAQASVDQFGAVSSSITGLGSCNGTCASITGAVTANPGSVNIPYTENPSSPSGTQLFSPVGGVESTSPSPLPLSTSVTLTDTVTLTAGNGTLAHESDLKVQIAQTAPTQTTVPEPTPFLAIAGCLVALASCTGRFGRRAAGGKQKS
jgi:hypothetical protein